MLEAGQTLSHYHLIEKIGEGGMGVVWKAEDTVLGRSVALKVLPPELVFDASRRDRFVREARTASSINHPNIAQVYELAEHEGTHFIAMEHVEGKTLRQLSRHGRIEPARLLDWMIQVTDALAKAHKAGVVHRDLKPENIMVNEDGLAKVLDFGLAKLMERPASDAASTQAPTADLTVTRQGTILGTAHYMSPEQARGEPVDHRSDLFSLGVVMYELATGRRPFEGDGMVEVLHAVMKQDPEPISDIDEKLPSELQRAVQRALAKRPDERYQDGRELWIDLMEARREVESGVAPTVQLPERPGRRERSLRPWLIGGGIVVGILLLGVAGYFTILRRSATSESSPNEVADPVSYTRVAVLPFAVHGSEEVAYLGEGMVDLLSTALDGAGEWRSADPRALLGLIQRRGLGPLDPEGGRTIAEQIGAGSYVLGSLVEAGGRLKASASLYDGTGRLQTAAEASVEQESELFDLVDDLARQLVGGQVAGPGDRLTRIATTTTTSLPALKAYLDGERAIRAGLESEAVEVFQRAVDLDPSFALAWYRLAVMARWTGQGELANEALEQARLHGDLLSERDRRRLEAFDAWLRGAADESEDLLRAIVTNYPDDVDAWYMLGESLFHYNPRHGRATAESREAFEQALVLEPEHHPSLLHLTNVAAKEGDDEELATLTDRFLDLAPDHWLAITLEVQRAVALDDRPAQQQLMADERLSRAGLTAVADVAKHIQDLSGAERLYRLFLEPEHAPETRLDALLSLAVVELARGRWPATRNLLAEAEAFGPEWTAVRRAQLSAASWLPLTTEELGAARDDVANLEPGDWFPEDRQDRLRPVQIYLTGALNARLGDAAAVLRSADRLDEIETVPGLGSLVEDFALALRARAAWMDGRPDAALQLLEQAQMDIGFPLDATSVYALGAVRYFRAELLNQLERYEEALPWYDSAHDRAIVNLIYLAPSHLRRAEIHERLGRPEQAARHYSRFIELWSDCDPELRSLVDGARTNLEALQAAGPSHAGKLQPGQALSM